MIMHHQPMLHHGISVTLEELLELRQPATHLDLTEQRNIRSQLLGGHLSVMRGRGIEFAEVRGYQAGDEIRHMEWRVTARTGKPQVKIFREERERPIFVVVDFNPSMFFGTRVAFKSVIAAQIAALLAWAAVKHHDRIGGLLFAGQQHLELKPHPRRQGVLPLLKGLSDFSQLSPATTASSNLSDACLKLRRVAKPGALTILISDFNSLDPEAAHHLIRLASQQQLIGCYIRDPLEILPPPPQRYAITDGTHISQLNTQDRRLCRQYQQHFAELHQRNMQQLQQAQIPVLNITTTDNLVVKLQQFFHLRRAGITHESTHTR